MVRVLNTVVFGFLCFSLVGCSNPVEEEPPWKELSIGDLAPAGSNDLGGRLLRTVNFNLLIFEIPVARADVLDVIWPILYTEPVRFRNFKAFSADSFAAGFGQRRHWPRVAELLYSAEAKKAQTISLILVPGQDNDVFIARLFRRESITYTSGEGVTKQANVGPGELVLRMRAEKIPGLRGLCSLGLEPVFVAPLPGPAQELAARLGTEDFEFDSTALSLKMAPGDFLLLGPKRYVEDRTRLASYFFNRSRPTARTMVIRPSEDSTQVRPYFGPVIRVYLFVCTAINY